MSEPTEIGLWRQAATIVAVGMLLGLFYNHLGLQAKPAWGMAWLQQDRGDAVTLEGLSGESGSEEEDFPQFEGDDPMGFGLSPSTDEAGSALPEIPELGRPIKMQLSAIRNFHAAAAAVFIDARELSEYAEGHIAGAISLPFDEAVTDPVRLEALETGGKPLITYCGGGDCELSLNLAWSLIEAGHTRVLVYEGGFPEWADAGYAVETGEGEQP